ncbi:hypothetical protein [Methanosarcina sp.]|uniref:hypothetical protein n=1 Tax=Methanosarcina sp. TaxID=2213 RepID=UPI003C7171C7
MILQERDLSNACTKDARKMHERRTKDTRKTHEGCTKIIMPGQCPDNTWHSKGINLFAVLP